MNKPLINKAEEVRELNKEDKKKAESFIIPHDYFEEAKIDLSYDELIECLA